MARRYDWCCPRRHGQKQWQGPIGRQRPKSLLRPSCRLKRLWVVVNRANPGQLVLINSEASWFYQHGFRRLTVSHFTPRLGFGINVALLAR